MILGIFVGLVIIIAIITLSCQYYREWKEDKLEEKKELDLKEERKKKILELKKLKENENDKESETASVESNE
jgi:hypothetical protein